MLKTARLDGAKVALIMREKPWNGQALSGGNDGGVREANFQIAILDEELAAAQQVHVQKGNKSKISLLDRLEELKGGVWSEPRVQQVIDLG